MAFTSDTPSKSADLCSSKNHVYFPISLQLRFGSKPPLLTTTEVPWNFYLENLVGLPLLRLSFLLQSRNSSDEALAHVRFRFPLRRVWMNHQGDSTQRSNAN